MRLRLLNAWSLSVRIGNGGQATLAPHGPDIVSCAGHCAKCHGGGSARRPVRDSMRRAKLNPCPESYCATAERWLECAALMRGGAVWQLVGLITRRSQVQILPPLPGFPRRATSVALLPGKAQEARAPMPGKQDNGELWNGPCAHFFLAGFAAEQAIAVTNEKLNELLQPLVS